MKIDKYNYESYLLDYVDGELTEDEQKDLMQYINGHPEIEKELKLLQKTKPETMDRTISFLNKDLLYRKERNNRKVFLFWRRIAVAAAAACLVFVLWRYFDNQSPILLQNEERISSVHESEKSVKPNIAHNAPKEEKLATTKVDSTKSAAPLMAHHVERRTSSKTPKHQTREENQLASAIGNDSTFKKISPIRGRVAAMFEIKEISISVKTVSDVAPEIYISKTAEKKIARQNNLSQNESYTLDRVRERKKDLDSTIIDKLYVLQDKIAHPIKALNIKVIKVGKISFLFN